MLAGEALLCKALNYLRCLCAVSGTAHFLAHPFSSPYEVAANARETNQNRPSAQSAAEAASLANR